MKSLEDSINAIVISATEAADQLAQHTKQRLECTHVLEALVDCLELEGQEKLVGMGLTSPEIVRILQDYDFRRLFPKLLGQVVLSTSIIPDGTSRLLTEVTIKWRGEVWRIHQNDADPFPSNPHAHNRESNLKLNMLTGELFNKKELKGTISKKDLLFINQEWAKVAKRRGLLTPAKPDSESSNISQI
jgi:hypothetical protein